MEASYPQEMTVCHECRRLDSGGLEDLRTLVASLRPRLVVIDTFNAVRRETDDRKPIQQREYGDLRGLKQLADEFDVAVVVVVHTRKSPGRGNSKRG